jgi:hypothetical protein
MAIGADATAGGAGGAEPRRAGVPALFVEVLALGFFIGKSFELKSSHCTREVLRCTTGWPPRTIAQPG